MKRPKIIAELSINHLGMRKIAILILRRCKEIGVDYVKLKIKDVKKYYAKGEKKYNGYDFVLYRNSLELSKDDFIFIDKWCKQNKVSWFATCHCLKSLKFISQFDVPFYKIASMDSQNLDFIKKVIKFIKKNKEKKSLIISVGGSSLKYIQKIVELVTNENIKLIINHVVSIYPTPIKKCNIKFITTLRKKFESSKVSIGYSGHEEGWLPTLFAVQNGARFIERHITLTKDLKIHHIKSALTIPEFTSMIKDIECLTKLMQVKDVDFYKEEFDFLKKRKYK